MSLVIEKFIVCDFQTSPNCIESFGVDERCTKTLKIIRGRARFDGWSTRGNKDICPNCRAKKKSDSAK